MVTKNFKTLMMLILQSNSNSVVKGMQPVVNVLGNTYYAANQVYDSMPSGTNTNFNLDASGTGISVGSGNTAATENGNADYIRTDMRNGQTVRCRRERKPLSALYHDDAEYIECVDHH